MTILVTGGAGFIGCNFIQDWLMTNTELVVNLDKLTYAGHLINLESVQNNDGHVFIRGDISDTTLTREVLARYRPRAFVHFAAESHVDRSIAHSDAFIHSNIVGTYRLLDVAHQYWEKLASGEKALFRFIHISTDEVFGSLAPDAPAFTEKSRYEPNNPYSASKAASDHLVRSFHQTYGLPVVTTHCSNNYGPFQFPEKLVPAVIINALRGKPLPLYGDGRQIRDWIHVLDHCHAIKLILEKGVPGDSYNIGSHTEKTNLEVVQFICRYLDEVSPRADGQSYREQIVFVNDRPGHDRRYAINAQKLKENLGWTPLKTFESGMDHTITWYLKNSHWISRMTAQLPRE